MTTSAPSTACSACVTERSKVACAILVSSWVKAVTLPEASQRCPCSDSMTS